MTEPTGHFQFAELVLECRFGHNAGWRPEGFEASLRVHLLGNQAQRVVIDISTMSKLAILLILSVCRELDMEVTILYAEAKTYGPTREEFEKAKENNEIHRPTLQIFTGVHGVVRVSSLASVAMQGQPTAALVFMSFNDALTQVLLNTVCPSRLFLINGRPPVHSWREEATAWIHDQVRREWDEDNPVVRTSEGSAPVPRRASSTLDYRETVSLLISLYRQLSATHRVLLAPGGSAKCKRLVVTWPKRSIQIFILNIHHQKAFCRNIAQASLRDGF